MAQFEPGHLHIERHALTPDDVSYNVHLDYEVKLRLMGPCAMFGPDGFPVTRLFNRAQGCMYTDRIVDEFGPKGVHFADLLSEVAA